MSQTDINKEIVRILMWVGGPLLAKWGIDADNSAAILGGAAALGTVIIWWAYSRFFSKSS